MTEKSVDPVKVYSEKELIREIEKIVSTLVPEKDWSLRIAAMQRVEGLMFGGLYQIDSCSFFFPFFLCSKESNFSFIVKFGPHGSGICESLWKSMETL